MALNHGWQPCRACHHPGQQLRVEGEWHLRANPGYWGASEPKVLVLGFSKGATQIAAAEEGTFDGVAFAGMRPRLEQVLDVLDIDLEGQTIDDALSASSQVIGAASLIRCGLSLMEKGALTTSGAIMPKAANTTFTQKVMRTCIAQHLDPLPASVKTVVLLGTTEAYIKGVKALMQVQFTDYQEVNEVAFCAQGRRWIFAAHPSPANGEFKHWLTGAVDSTSGRKRHLALQTKGISGHTVPVECTPPPNAITSATLPATPRINRRSAGPSRSSADRFAQSFHLVRADGRKIVPVMMKNRDTGTIAFRIAKMGNKKDGTREVFDEAELLKCCESGQYQVRAQPLDMSSPPNFVRPLLNYRIVKGPARC